MQWQEKADAVQCDPAASNWLKAAVRDCLERDPVDALDDIEYLWEILEDKHTEILRIHGVI